MHLEAIKTDYFTDRPDVTIYPVQNPYEVIENTTTFHLTCTITEANPAVMSYRWYKDGVKVSTAATYIIPKVYRYHTGSYTCDASNIVGISDSSSVLQLNVLCKFIYKPHYQQSICHKRSLHLL